MNLNILIEEGLRKLEDEQTALSFALNPPILDSNDVLKLDRIQRAHWEQHDESESSCIRMLILAGNYERLARSIKDNTARQKLLGLAAKNYSLAGHVANILRFKELSISLRLHGYNLFQSLYEQAKDKWQNSNNQSDLARMLEIQRERDYTGERLARTHFHYYK